MFAMQNVVIKKPTINGMLSIMKACVNAKTVRKLVFTSSAAAVRFGEHEKPVYDENCWTDVELCRNKKMTGWVKFYLFIYYFTHQQNLAPNMLQSLIRIGNLSN